MKNKGFYLSLLTFAIVACIIIIPLSNVKTNKSSHIDEQATVYDTTTLNLAYEAELYKHEMQDKQIEDIIKFDMMYLGAFDEYRPLLYDTVYESFLHTANTRFYYTNENHYCMVIGVNSINYREFTAKIYGLDKSVLDNKDTLKLLSLYFAYEPLCYNLKLDEKPNDECVFCRDTLIIKRLKYRKTITGNKH